MAEKKHKGIENLKSLKDRTTEEQREIARKGGIKSGKVRKERKLMSQIYADFLAQKHEIEVKGIKKKVDGHEYMRIVADAIIQNGGSPAVSLLKEIREATEGSKVHIDTDINIIYADDQDSKL